MKCTRSVVTKNIINQLLLLCVTCSMIYIMLPRLNYYSNKDSIVKSELDMNEKLMQEMDDYFKGISKFASIICNDATVTDLVSRTLSSDGYRSKKLMENYLANASNYYYMDSYQVIHICLHLDNGETINSVGMPDSMNQYIMNIMCNKYNKETNNCFMTGPFTISDPRQAGVFVDRSNKMFCYFSPYVNSRGYTGELVIVSSYDTITNILKSYTKDDIDFMLLDQDNNPVYPGRKFADSLINIDMVKQSSNQEYYNFETYKYINGGLLSIRNSLSSKWKLVRYDSEDKLMKSSIDICNQIIALIVACSIIYCIFAILLSQKSLLVIKSLSRQMHEISRGNYGARLSVHTNDEIETLGNAFNDMADKLQKNIQKLMEQERREQAMKYSLLVSQIDPHFIYNAMNTITYLASSNQPEAVIEVNRSIIGILKDRLRVGSFKVSDSLRQEIDTIKNYLVIQGYRYKDMFDVRWDIDESLLDIEVPKNILQPLVENALYHGILANKDENGDIIGGYITITAKESDGFLVLSVKDNGIGMPQSTIDKVMQSENGSLGNNTLGEHIGICNILARLRYIYKNEFSFSIEGKEDLGTEITIKIGINKPEHQ